MAPDPMTSAGHASRSDTVLSRVLGGTCVEWVGLDAAVIVGAVIYA